MLLPLLLLLLSLLSTATSFTAPSASAFANRVQISTKTSTATQLNALKKDVYSVALLKGDGIGPEISQATLSAVHAITKKHSFKINFTPAHIGGAALDACDHPFPDMSLEICKKSDSILLACIGGYKWDNYPREKRPETGLLRMRKELNLYANLRPAKVMENLIGTSTLKPEVIRGVDIMVVRELTGDVYFGTPKGTTEIPSAMKPGHLEKYAYNNMCYSSSEIERIARVAGRVAMERGGSLVSVDKANVLDVSQLWRDTVHETISKEFPSVLPNLTNMLVDNCAMQLIRNPKQFTTLLTPNLFGDILSDEASMLVGSLGLLPSASLGDPGMPGVYEPCHGSAPDIAGLDKANPIAMILSFALMLRYDLNRPEAALIVEKAVEMVLDGGFRTGDIFSGVEGTKLVGCKEMGERIGKAIESC